MTVILRATAFLPPHAMRIIESGQPLTVPPVQRERVVDAVRFLRRHWHLRYDEPDPVTALRVDHENLAVELKKNIESRVARLLHGM